MLVSTASTSPSHMTDETAVSRLCELVDSPSCDDLLGRSAGFAVSLVSQWRTKGRLSERQWPYVHSLVTETIERVQRQASTPDSQAGQQNGHSHQPAAKRLGDASALYAMFDHAAARLQYPKLHFELDGQHVKLYRAGERSNYSGQLIVTDDGRYPDNQFFGVINRQGEFKAGRACTPEIEGFLVKFIADPANIAAEYGRQTGNCCFCSRDLTDPRSVEVGYGPICADHYSLPWGN